MDPKLVAATDGCVKHNTKCVGKMMGHYELWKQL